MRSTLWVGLLGLRLGAQITGLQVTGVTHTQAILSYTAPRPAPCTIEVSESPSFAPLVHDVNGRLFAGANSDATRRLGSGRTRLVVIGKRQSDKAADGRLYSRALATDTVHYVRVTCGSSQATTQFRTRTIAWGDSSSEPPPYHPDGFGFYGWPTIDWSNRDATYVDPMTGVKIKLMGWPGSRGRHFEVNAAPDHWWDWNGAWSNPHQIRSGTTSQLASTAAANAPIFVGIDPAPGGNIPWSSSGYASFSVDTTIDDVGVRIFGSGSDGNPANRTVRVCLSMDSGQSCYSPAVDVVLPQGSPQDNGIFPAVFPKPMFASWGARPVPRHLWPHQGNVTVAGNTVTLTNPSTRSIFLTSWPPGTKIWISGSAPACPHNLCTITRVQDATQLTIRESLNISTPTVYKAMNFGYRIVKTTNAGTVSLSVRRATAWSYVTMRWAGGSKKHCSFAPVTTKVDRDGNPLPQPKKGYLCLATQNPALDESPPVFWVSEEDGESRLISLHTIPTSMPGHLSEDMPRPGALTPAGTWARFDPVQGNVWYTVVETNSKDASGAYKRSLFRITYTGDYREYKPGYVGSEGGKNPPESTVWENLTRPSQNRDLQAQIDRAGIPGWDRNRFGIVTECRSAESGAIVCGKEVSGQDSPGWLFVFDTRGNLVKGFNSWDGRVFPTLRWMALHSWGDSDVRPGPGNPGLVTLAATPIKIGNNTRLLGGPFETRVTAVKRSWGWDSANTSVSSTIGDSSYEAACPTNLPAQWTNLGATGNNCLQVRVQGEPCSSFATANEKTWWPCPWDSNRSTLAGNRIQEGDWVFDGTAGNSERMLVVRRTDLPGGAIELVLRRYMPHNYTCGSLTSERTHANGWVLRMGIPWGCGEVNAHVSVAPNDTRVYFPRIFGHSDTGVGATPDTLKRAGPFCAEISGTANEVLNSPTVSPDICWTLFPAFEGVAGHTGGVQSYPSLAQFNAQGSERYWMLDNHHIEAAGWSLNMVREPGQVYTWRMNVQGSVDIKRRPIIAWVAHYLLRDISGPRSLISDATPWTYCYAYKAGECRPGSQAGQFFVAAPAAVSGTQCPGFDQYSAYQGVPCAISGGTLTSWTIQRLLDVGGGQRFRRITMGFSGHNRQGPFARSDSFPEGRWIKVPGYWLDGVRSDFLLVKVPATDPIDGVDRSRFQMVRLKLPAASNATHAVVDFGYEEFGSPTDFYCTTRREGCTVPGVAPFSFASEPISPAACSGGCTIDVPALPQKILYYRARYLNASGQTVSTSPVQAAAVY